VDWLSKREKALLGDDMGLGKTIQALMALEQEAAAMVVCPASLKGNWADECRKWRPDLKPVILTGHGTFRFPVAGELVIVNYDILPKWLKPEKRTPTGPAWDVEVKLPLVTREAVSKVTFIADEGHRVKNYKTARSQRVKGLAMVCGKVWVLTGTPLENRPMDLWGMLSAFGFAHIVFGTFARFVDFMGGVKDSWGGYQWGIPKFIVPELMRRVMLRRRREVVLPDLPHKTYTTITCDLPEDLRSEMDSLWNEWSETIKSKELPPFEEFSSIRAKLAASRIPQLTELVEDCEEQNCPVVVFSAHLAPVEAMRSREGWTAITGSTPEAKRHQIVADFQAGKFKGIALTIGSGGVGLTLTHAWKVIRCDLDWVPSKNEQAADRVCRIGQTSNRVEIIDLVSEHPLDQHVLKLIAWKVGIIEAALEKVMEADLTSLQGNIRLAYLTAAMVAEAQSGGVEISDKRLTEIHAALKAAGVPQDCFLPQLASETEAQFQARMERARAFAEAAVEERDPAEVNDWLPLNRDKDIPF
jgi:SWI/SNF-related matrix-associated actin-dependent regulator 1 of chromatin subfamily A